MNRLAVYRNCLFSVFAALAVALPNGVLADLDPQEKQLLQAFVRTHYHHGLPTQVAVEFGEGAVPELISMLNDPAEKQAWPNIVYMLGILNDGAATGPLIQFLEGRFVGEVDSPTYRALVAVPNSLGLVAKGENSDAERYLIRGLNSSSWNQRRIKWTYPSLNTEDKKLLLTKLSVAGAANTGSKATLRELEKLRTSVESKNTRTKLVLMPSINEAILVNKLISIEGRSLLFRPEELKKKIELQIEPTVREQ